MTSISAQNDTHDRRPCYVDDGLLATGDALGGGLVPDRFEASSRDDFPLVGVLNFLFNEAAENGYSDIHFESGPRGLVVRYRQFGVMTERMVLDGGVSDDLGRLLRARAQVRDKDDIAPRDGTFWFRADTRTVDVRLNFLSTRAGTSTVCRLLDQTNATRAFSSIPMTDLQREVFRDSLYANEGLILTVGPTGSGKTSTLYSCLNERNTPDVKILTAEDPVEYTLPNAQQVNVVRPLRTFPIVVRAGLRQDIDIALIGEIRDAETAGAAVDIANTGHLVLSTLHANTASSSINRLLVGLGADAFALAAALRLIVAQRLVRQLCSHCRVIDELSDGEIGLLQSRNYVTPTGAGLRGLYASKRSAEGCDACDGRGTKGIRPILEFLRADADVRGAIERGAGLKEIYSVVSAQQSHRSLNHAAIDAAICDFNVDLAEALSCAAQAD